MVCWMKRAIYKAAGSNFLNRVNGSFLYMIGLWWFNFFGVLFCICFIIPDTGIKSCHNKVSLVMRSKLDLKTWNLLLKPVVLFNISSKISKIRTAIKKKIIAPFTFATFSYLGMCDYEFVLSGQPIIKIIGLKE